MTLQMDIRMDVWGCGGVGVGITISQLFFKKCGDNYEVSLNL